MKKVEISNAWGTAKMIARQALEQNVVLLHESSITSFYFIMTIDQTREMAAALIAFSDIQDAKVAKAE